jgi:hypothetical protein
MNPIPSVQAILMCEKIIQEAETKKQSLISIFTAIHAPSLPVHMSMGLYARLTDGEGTYEFKIDIVHLSDDRKVASATLPGLESKDRLAPMEVVVHIPHIQFDSAGKYEFQLSADGVFLGHASVDVFVGDQSDARG